jgi:hypothetical protein
MRDQYLIRRIGMGRHIDWKLQMESDARELTRIAWTRQYGEENVDIYEYERGNNPPNYTDWFEERGLKSKFFLKGKRRLFENE